MDEHMTNAIVALKENRCDVFYAEDKAEAREIVLGIIEEGASIAVGGSETLNQLDLLTAFRSGKYNFIDRYAGSPEEQNEARRQGLLADYFVMSSNAITEKGELYNVDGAGNRIAALNYGPKYVIIVAGKNKIVPTLEDAVLRVKEIAAPLNAKRLNCETYCTVKGHCVSIDEGKGGDMLAGCSSPKRICLKTNIQHFQRFPGRVKVVLVNEDLGY